MNRNRRTTLDLTFRFCMIVQTIDVAQRVVSCSMFIGHVSRFGNRLPDRLFFTLAGAIAPDFFFRSKEAP